MPKCSNCHRQQHQSQNISRFNRQFYSIKKYMSQWSYFFVSRIKRFPCCIKNNKCNRIFSLRSTIYTFNVRRNQRSKHDKVCMVVFHLVVADKQGDTWDICRQINMSLYSNYIANVVAGLYQSVTSSCILRCFNGIAFTYIHQ